jgi:hypothetical protein
MLLSMAVSEAVPDVAGAVILTARSNYQGVLMRQARVGMLDAVKITKKPAELSAG